MLDPKFSALWDDFEVFLNKLGNQKFGVLCRGDLADNKSMIELQ